jgi:nitrogen fixation protein FixH
MADQGLKPQGKPLTGRKVLAIVLSAFGVIIAVNIVLAVFAVRSFPGLEVANSYVASQQFNDRADAQRGLGWDVAAHLEGAHLIVAITDAQTGRPVRAAPIDATLGRATHVRDDMTPEFLYSNGVYTAPVTLGPGNWNLRMTARAEDGTEFRQRVVLHVQGG